MKRPKGVSHETTGNAHQDEPPEKEDFVNAKNILIQKRLGS
jgi:hypothetical protein